MIQFYQNWINTLQNFFLLCEHELVEVSRKSRLIEMNVNKVISARDILANRFHLDLSGLVTDLLEHSYWYAWLPAYLGSFCYSENFVRWYFMYCALSTLFLFFY